MTLNRCENGHFYDADRFPACPFCHQTPRSGFSTQAAPADPRIPSRFNDMGKLSYEHSGSVGKVYRLTVETNYALKQIDCRDDMIMFKNALYELDVMKRLSGCDRVVQLVDSEIVTRGSEYAVYLLQEYHTPLNTWLRENHPSVSHHLQLMADLCDALIQCRDRGVLHLDIRPDNLFVDKHSRVKLGDFSCSLLITDLARNHIPRGTSHYMAPEICSQGLCSEQSEIYSVGVMLEQILDILLRGGWTGASGKEMVSYVLDHTLNPNPAQRFRTFEELREIILRMAELLQGAYSGNIAESCPDYYAAAARREPPAPAVEASAGTVFFDADEFGATTALTESLYSGPSVPLAPPDPVFAGSEGTALLGEDDASVTATLTQSLYSTPSVPLAPPAPTPPAQADGRAAPRSTAFCPACGSPLSAGSVFCYNCGSRVGAAPASPPSMGTVPMQPAPSPVRPAPAPFMPAQPMPPAQTAPQLDMRKAQFSAVVPKTFLRGEYTMVEIVMYEEKFRHVVDELIAQAEGPVSETRSGVMKVAEDSRVRITLTSPDVEIEDNTDEQVWSGDYLNFTFAVELPEDYKKKQILFTAAVYINDFIATRLKFVAKVRSFLEQKVTLTREDVLSAFVSYASQDRARVATIIQGMRKARPEMDIFFDVDSLRSGEDWELALRREIERRDILYLCWSQNARASRWVDTEWRLALAQKGVECIEPIAIDPPDICPPPEELIKKHFNDKLLYYINAPRP